MQDGKELRESSNRKHTSKFTCLPMRRIGSLDCLGSLIIDCVCAFSFKCDPFSSELHPVHLQVLSLVRDFRMKPTEKARLNALLTFAKCGDIEGAKRTAAMFQSLGCLSDYKVRNVILSSYVNYPDNTKWTEMMEYYNASFGPRHIRPTFYTMQWLMRAALKYGKPEAAIQLFYEALHLKLGSEDLKDELKITLGDEKFEEFWSTLHPEHQALCGPTERHTVTADSSEVIEALDGASAKSQGVQGHATDLEESTSAGKVPYYLLS